jgi:Ca2+-binding RTX toxin-like protein
VGRAIRLIVAIAAALSVGLMSASVASAGTVCKVGTQALFSAPDIAGCGGGAAAGEANSVKVDTNAAGDIVITDSKPITDGDGAGGCTVSGATAVCPGTTGYLAQLGDGNDSLTVGNTRSAGASTGDDGADTMKGGPGPDAFDGGAGADTLSGGAGDDLLMGGDGNDVVTGGEGNDQLELALPGLCGGSAGDDQLGGEGGDDTLCGGSGPGGGTDNDALNGGDGVDTVQYPRVKNVAVSLDGSAGDGEQGESDNVNPDVENVSSGQGNDSLTGNDAPNVLDGGAGADSLNGGGGDDTLTDSGGDAAADSLNGGAGDDVLSAGRGPDGYSGGDGDDWVPDYANRTTPVTVTLDGTADDGASGEGDNAGADVENVVGGAASDALTGNAADNELIGGGGSDTVSGGAGNDGLLGGTGRDTLDGGGGRDRLDGGAGADKLKAAGDGTTDRLDCGGGTDSVEAERRDDISGDCEDRAISAPTTVGIGSVVVSRAGYVVVRVTCPAVEPFCSGVMTVKTVRRIGRFFIILGKTSYRVRSGATLAVRAKIPKTYRKALRKRRRVGVRAIVPNTNTETGQSTSATKLATVTTRGL